MYDPSTLEARLADWHRRRYPDSHLLHPNGVNVPATLRKLGEEFGELAESLAAGEHAHAVEECADCAIVLVHLVRGLAPDASLLAAMHDKLTVLEERQLARDAGRAGAGSGGAGRVAPPASGGDNSP